MRCGTSTAGSFRAAKRAAFIQQFFKGSEREWKQEDRTGWKHQSTKKYA
ncbi:hypothetical protein SD78_2817 [Bacillus badius]|nr:hypothetical protein SD78_2817 [Bacillus badius]